MATIDNAFFESTIDILTRNTMRLEIELDTEKKMTHDAINKCKRLTAENAKLKEEIDELKAKLFISDEYEGNFHRAAINEVEKLRRELARMRKWAITLEKLSDKQLAECIKLHEAITSGIER